MLKPKPSCTLRKIISVPQMVLSALTSSSTSLIYKLDSVCRKIEEIRTHKQEIKVISVTSHPDYDHLVNIVVEFEPIKGQIIQTMMTSFKPPRFSYTTQSEIDEIETVGLQWADSQKLYPDGQIKGLAATFCSALVHFSYSSPLFSKQERLALREWIDVLFANDDKRDKILPKAISVSTQIPQFVELPVEVRHDNDEWLSIIDKFQKGELSRGDKFQEISSLASTEPVRVYLSPKAQATLDVLTTLFPDRNIPGFFKTSLERYVTSTIDEAGYQVALKWPTESKLGLLKGVSSGSEHAINVGLSIRAPHIDLSELNRDRLVASIASLVEHHNDVDSHAKEQRERLSKLGKIFYYIKENAAGILPLIENPSAIQDPQLKYIVEFYKKFTQEVEVQAQAIGKDKLSFSEGELVDVALRILPSYNLIDVYYRSGESLSKSYQLVAAKGNGALDVACNFIENLEAEKLTLGLSSPKIGEIDALITISKGWGQQNYWAWSAKRYSEGVLEMNASSLVRIIETVYDKLGV